MVAEPFGCCKPDPIDTPVSLESQFLKRAGRNFCATCPRQNSEVYGVLECMRILFISPAWRVTLSGFQTSLTE